MQANHRGQARDLRLSPRRRSPGLSAVRNTSLQGLEPVGKGHAAAGLRAVFAPSGVVIIEDAVPADPAVADGFVAAFLAVFRFAFFLADFLAGLLSAFLFLLPAALFFFFFFAAFLLFLFFAISASVQSCEKTFGPAPRDGPFNPRDPSPEN